MIWKRIKEIRSETGLSQGEFARSIMVSRRQLVYWEKGEIEPSGIYLEKISFVYNVNVDWLKTGKRDKYPISENEMNSERAQGFIESHKEVEQERPGLYSLLNDAAGDKFLIREDEAEYLTQAELPAHDREDYLAELGRYRERQHRATSLTPQESKIIQKLRSMQEEERQEVMEYLEFKARKTRKK